MINTALNTNIFTYYLHLLLARANHPVRLLTTTIMDWPDMFAHKRGPNSSTCMYVEPPIKAYSNYTCFEVERFYYYVEHHFVSSGLNLRDTTWQLVDQRL